MRRDVAERGRRAKLAREAEISNLERLLAALVVVVVFATNLKVSGGMAVVSKRVSLAVTPSDLMRSSQYQTPL